MKPDTLSRAVLFADISGSVRLYDTHGDAKAHALIKESIAVFRSAVTDHGGTVIKTIGDEVMATFTDAKSAYLAAVSIQEHHAERPLDVKVGFHYGEVIEADGDVFGDAVNVAARMVALATRGEIITTQGTVDELAPEYQDSVRHLDTASVKGKDVPMDVFQIVWASEDMTMVDFDPASTDAFSPHYQKLVLVADGGSVTIKEGDTPFSIGRKTENKLVVEDGHVSRTHMTVDFRRDRFFITDHSSRGTFICLDGTEEVLYLKRESVELRGTGSLFLGQAPTAETAYRLDFTVIEDT